MDYSTEFRLFMPEFIWLEPQHFDRAIEMSEQVAGEVDQWQTYLNALALLGFEQWLHEQIPEQPVNRDNYLLLPPQYINVIEAICNLKIGDFKLCLIATEHLLDEVVNVPQHAIDTPKNVAHFYVVIEVLEEQEKVIIRGVLRYDQLVNYRSRSNLQLSPDGCYQLPLSEFEAEPNHLLFYCRFLEPTAIPLPSVIKTEENLLGYLKETRTKLSQWLQGVFDESWQAIDALTNPKTNLALSTRTVEEGAKKGKIIRGKLINLGMQVGCQTVTLLVNITEEDEGKLGVLIQLHPTGGERYLPPNLNLTLFSKVGKKLQEVQSRSQDNYIQLKPFKGEAEKRFSVEISLLDVSVTENFEL